MPVGLHFKSSTELTRKINATGFELGRLKSIKAAHIFQGCQYSSSALPWLCAFEAVLRKKEKRGGGGGGGRDQNTFTQIRVVEKANKNMTLSLTQQLKIGVLDNKKKKDIEKQTLLDHRLTMGQSL